MGYRQLYIKKAKMLRLENDNIKIIREENELLFPLEDLSSILLEDPHTVITSRLLTKLAEFSVVLTLCNERYMPSTQVLPLNSYYNQVGVYRLQLEASQVLKNRLWQCIIKEKIVNQAKVIQLTTENEAVIEMLNEYAKGVKSNDNDNREGISARVFFSQLYGPEFNRFGNSAISNALNYGYSILHSCIVRQLICFGFNTNIGIWHNSSQNAYNLASDLIEPYRPVVDYYVYWHKDDIFFPLDKKIRMQMVNLLNENVLIDDKKCKVEFAINVTVNSFQRVLETQDIRCLKLPSIIEVNFYGEE